MEHFWRSVPGFFQLCDTQFYKAMIDRVQSPAHFVEVGSYKGRSSAYMAVECANSGKVIQFDCVDTWMGSEEHQKGKNFEDDDVVNNRLFEVFTNNMKPVEGLYKAIRLASVDAAATYEDGSLDFVFIDASHDYENVKADVIAWYPKVKVGGIISGHDFHHDVADAVHELLWNVENYNGCWVVEKDLTKNNFYAIITHKQI